MRRGTELAHGMWAALYSPCSRMSISAMGVPASLRLCSSAGVSVGSVGGPCMEHASAPKSSMPSTVTNASLAVVELPARPALYGAGIEIILIARQSDEIVSVDMNLHGQPVTWIAHLV